MVWIYIEYCAHLFNLYLVGSESTEMTFVQQVALILPCNVSLFSLVYRKLQRMILIAGYVMKEEKYCVVTSALVCYI